MDTVNLKLLCLQYKAGLISKTEFFETIWNSHGKKISFYINRLIFSRRSDSEDLFQEIMLKIYNNLENYNPLYSFDTWAYKITRHHCIDCLRKQESSVDQDGMDDFPETKNNPEKQYLESEIMQKIEKAINGLGDTEKELAFLRLFENMKFQAISEITGININTLKTRIEKIKQKLRHQLRDYSHE